MQKKECMSQSASALTRSGIFLLGLDNTTRLNDIKRGILFFHVPLSGWELLRDKVLRYPYKYYSPTDTTLGVGVYFFFLVFFWFCFFGFCFLGLWHV